MQDDSANLDQAIMKAAQQCVGVIYSGAAHVDPLPLATGIVVRVFTDKDTDPLYSSLKQSNHETEDFPEILGMVMTAKHIIQREDGSDNTMGLFFSLKN